MQRMIMAQRRASPTRRSGMRYFVWEGDVSKDLTKEMTEEMREVMVDEARDWFLYLYMMEEESLCGYSNAVM
jgi:hypothetical protein